MRHILSLAKRELTAYLLSPVGYIIAFLFILLYMIFFYAIFKQSTDANGVLVEGIGFVQFFAILAIPFFTMGLLADEKRSGTIEMLMTAPVADWEVVIGKYIGCLAFAVLLVLPSLAELVIVRTYGLPEWGPVISGYVGLLMLLMLLVSMGLFFSSISKSPLVAVMMSFVVFITLLVIGALVPENTAAVETAGNVFSNLLTYVFAFLRYASLGEHYMSFGYGAINSRDIVYFLSGTGFFLFLSTLAVESRKWK